MPPHPGRRSVVVQQALGSAVVETAWFSELAEWIAMPSVSADEAHAPDVRRAGDWLCERIRAAGGEAELVDWGEKRSPLAIGELREARLLVRTPRDVPTPTLATHDARLDAVLAGEARQLIRRDRVLPIGKCASDEERLRLPIFVQETRA